MEYHNLSDAYEAFTEYRKFGGMSGSYVYSDEKSSAEALLFLVRVTEHNAIQHLIFQGICFFTTAKLLQ